VSCGSPEIESETIDQDKHGKYACWNVGKIQAGINQVPSMIPVLSNNRTLECNKLVMKTSRNFDAH